MAINEKYASNPTEKVLPILSQLSKNIFSLVRVLCFVSSKTLFGTIKNRDWWLNKLL
jgi:hypothetical protein